MLLSTETVDSPSAASSAGLLCCSSFSFIEFFYTIQGLSQKSIQNLSRTFSSLVLSPVIIFLISYDLLLNGSAVCLGW